MYICNATESGRKDSKTWVWFWSRSTVQKSPRALMLHTLHHEEVTKRLKTPILRIRLVDLPLIVHFPYINHLPTSRSRHIFRQTLLHESFKGSLDNVHLVPRTRCSRR